MPAMEYQISTMNIELPNYMKNSSSNRSRARSFISTISNKSSLSNNFIEKHELAWPDPKHVYRASGPFDLRCPYPEVNALANHSYINHNGRGITFESLADSIIEVYNPDFRNHPGWHVMDPEDTDMDGIDAPSVDTSLAEGKLLNKVTFNLWNSEMLRLIMEISMPENYQAHLTRIQSRLDPLRNLKIKDAYLKATSIEKSEFCDCFVKWAWRRMPMDVSREDFDRILRETNPRRDDDYPCSHRDVRFRVEIPPSSRASRLE